MSCSRLPQRQSPARWPHQNEGQVKVREVGTAKPKAAPVSSTPGQKQSSSLGGMVLFTVSYLLLGHAQEAFQFLWPLRLTLISCIFAVIFIFVKKGLGKKKISELFCSNTFKWYATLMGISFITLPFSIYPSFSLSYFIEIFLQINAVFILLLNACVDEYVDLRWVIRSVFAIALSLALIAFFIPRYVDGRVTPTYHYDPNDFSLLMICITAFVFPSAKIASITKKMLVYATVLMTFMSVYLSQSRGGFLALGAVILAEAFFHNVKTVVVRFIVFCTLTVVMFYGGFSSQIGRLGEISDLQDDYNATASTGRVAVWERGLNIILENPLTGVGLHTFMVAEGASHAGGKWSEAHNSFIQVGAELGIPGLIVFLGMLLSAFRRAKSVSPEDWIGRGIRLMLVAFVVGGFFLSWAYQFALYFFLGIAMVRERLLAQAAMKSPHLPAHTDEQRHVAHRKR